MLEVQALNSATSNKCGAAQQLKNLFMLTTAPRLGNKGLTLVYLTKVANHRFQIHSRAKLLFELGTCHSMRAYGHARKRTPIWLPRPLLQYLSPRLRWVRQLYAAEATETECSPGAATNLLLDSV